MGWPGLEGKRKENIMWGSALTFSSRVARDITFLSWQVSLIELKVRKCWKLEHGWVPPSPLFLLLSVWAADGSLVGENVVVLVMLLTWNQVQSLI